MNTSKGVLGPAVMVLCATLTLAAESGAVATASYELGPA